MRVQRPQLRRIADRLLLILAVLNGVLTVSAVLFAVLLYIDEVEDDRKDKADRVLIRENTERLERAVDDSQRNRVEVLTDSCIATGRTNLAIITILEAFDATEGIEPLLEPLRTAGAVANPLRAAGRCRIEAKRRVSPDPPVRENAR